MIKLNGEKIIAYKDLCFVDMPFGKKTDLASGAEIDFDHIYESAIKPAIKDVGLDPLRGDEEKTGGIIHQAMFARLLLAEYVVADLTLANPNVFYELGIRHAAKPFTTVSIYANTHPLPFDVTMIRAVLYQLDSGRLTDNASEQLRSELRKRLEQAIKGQATKDSPLFQLIPKFPGIDLPHEVTDAFQDRVKHEREFQDKLDQAKSKESNDERRKALLQIQQELGELKTVQRNVLIDMMLSFRAVEAWREMVNLCENLPDHLQNIDIVRQQWALALNRRNTTGDREKAISLLDNLIKEHGYDPETLGILGRVHKDRYKEFKKKGDIMASAALDDAIEAYIRGFISDPRDYYPGINAVTLLIEKGDEEALKKAKEYAPLVSFSVARRGGANSSDYWDVATVLEMACINNDWNAATRTLPKVLNLATLKKESWMPKSTMENLIMLKSRQAKESPELDAIIEHLGQCVTVLEGKEK
jgi:tetratricopeptide (TPR) repeat protein